MAITDLTNTIWTPNSSVEFSKGSSYNINFISYINNENGTSNTQLSHPYYQDGPFYAYTMWGSVCYNNDKQSTGHSIDYSYGFTSRSRGTPPTIPARTDIPIDRLKIYITGGSDATNTTLITWLTNNGTLIKLPILSYSTEYGIAPASHVVYYITKKDIPYIYPVNNNFMTGWYYDSEFENLVYVDDKITEDTTIYAKWVGYERIGIIPQIERIKDNIEDAYDFLESKGITTETKDSEHLKNYIDELISSSPTSLTANSNGVYIPPENYNNFSLITVNIPEYQGEV